MTVLVTGSTGFLGSHLIHALLENNFSVIAIKRKTSNLWRIQDILDRIKLYDISDLDNAFNEQHIDCVIHTACCYGRKNETLKEIIDTNIGFGLTLLEKSVKFNTDTFFNTDTLLSRYLNNYSLSKKQFVEWLKMKSDKIQVVNMKLEHMYGPKDDSTKFVPWVLSQLQENATCINLTKGEQKRDFIYVEDVVSAYLTVLKNIKKEKKFTEFDVGTGNSTTVKHFITKLDDLFKQANPNNKTKLNFGKLPYRDGEIMDVRVDNSGLLKLGWKPEYTIEKGLISITPPLSCISV